VETALARISTNTYHRVRGSQQTFVYTTANSEAFIGEEFIF
jgi:hypothetical protein